MTAMKVYKAQWPLTGDEIVIYEAERRDGKWYFMPATPEARKELFANKYVRVFFRGRIKGDTVEVDKFVRKEHWV